MAHGHAFRIAHAAKRRRSKDTGQDTADDATHAVDTEHVAWVIHAQPAFQGGDAPQTSQTDDDPQDQRTADADITARWGDTNQARNRTGTCAQQRRLTAQRPFAKYPAKNSSSGSDNGVHEGQTGNFVCRTGGTGVETEPAKVEDCGTDKHHRQVVRFKRFFAKAHAFANQVCADQTCHRRVNMHHRTARKVERTVARQQTAAPDHVGNRHVGEGQPNDYENQYRGEANTLRQRAHNQAHGDTGEGALERYVDILIERAHQIGNLDIFQHHPVEAAEEAAAGTESQ